MHTVRRGPPWEDRHGHAARRRREDHLRAGDRHGHAVRRRRADHRGRHGREWEAERHRGHRGREWAEDRHARPQETWDAGAQPAARHSRPRRHRHRRHNRRRRHRHTHRHRHRSLMKTTKKTTKRSRYCREVRPVSGEKRRREVGEHEPVGRNGGDVLEDELGAHGLAGAGFAGNDDALRLVLLGQPAVHSVDAGGGVSRGGQRHANKTEGQGRARAQREEQGEERGRRNRSARA